MNEGWIKHDGKGVPVGGKTKVQIRQRCGWQSARSNTAEYWESGSNNWVRSKIKKLKAYEITHYRIIEEETK